MATTVEYGTYIIDLCSAMLENPAGLNKAQAKRVAMIQREAVKFLTDYLRHESSSLPDLLRYLTQDATESLRVLITCCDMVLNGNHGEVVDDYGEAINEIRDCGYAMVEDVEDMRQNLDQLMDDLGMV